MAPKDTINVKPSFTRRWPFYNWKCRTHSFHLQNTDEKNINNKFREETHGTFRPRLKKLSSRNITSIKLRTNSLIWETSPSTSRPHRYTLIQSTQTQTDTHRYWLSFVFHCLLNLTELTLLKQKVRALLQNTRERSEVESSSICSRTRPSVAQIHPFHLHYCRNWTLCSEWVTRSTSH